jgi:hypothetical protein
MEVVFVQVLGVDAVAEVIEGVSKVVVVKVALVANSDYISIIHLWALRDDSVLEIIVVPRKRNCVGFEKWTELIVVKLIVGEVQVTVLGWPDLGDVCFVFYSIPECHWKC